MEAQTFEEIVRGYRSKLVARIGRQAHGLALDQDELLQETLIRIWRACKSDREVESPAAYAEQLIANVIVDALRRRREGQEDLSAEIASTAPSPCAVSEQAQDVAQVLATLGTLDERRRTATGLLLQGFVCDEIAARLGISEAAARNLAYRGLDDLRQRLQPQFAA